MAKKEKDKDKSKKSGKKKDVKGPAASILESHGVELCGFMLLTAALALLLSLVSFSSTPKAATHWLGAIGHAAGGLFHLLLGLGSYFVVLFAGWMGWRLFFGKSINKLAEKVAAFAIMTISFCLLMSLVEDTLPHFSAFLRWIFYPQHSYSTRYHLGGAPFYYLWRDLPEYNLSYALNTLGVALIFFTLFCIGASLLLKLSPKAIVSLFFQKENAGEAAEAAAPSAGGGGGVGLINPLRFVKVRTPFNGWGNSKEEDATTGSKAMADSGATASGSSLLAIKPEIDLKQRPSLSHKESNSSDCGNAIPVPPSGKNSSESKATAAPPLPSKGEKVSVEASVYKSYRLPSPSLLNAGKKVDQTLLKKGLRHQAEVLEETLHSFGIEAKVGQINCGPTITSFEVHPAIGVKVQKIKSLESDIALNMEAKSIRIIAPIPGKAAVGIEVPNAIPQEVSFREMLQAYQQSGRSLHIPILLGKAVNGDYVMSDLAKMPHCIIAGATGSGKSVCINTIVMSIVMNAKPDEVKLVMVDPKKVELTPYSRMPHMLAPVITEPKGACAALQWLVKEMEKRYEILKRVGVRNIDAFNNRKVDADVEKELGIEIPDTLTYIVAIIDELADLMMVASNDIETFIARIAQMARAVGIHLILATQRPSREVITGLIKANFPTRISFKVASRINSQIILDETGAETLLGNGDMLFLPPGAHHLIRAQGAFVRDEDINQVIEHVCRQAPPKYLIDSFDAMAEREEEGDDVDDDDNDNDPFYRQAKGIAIATGNASVPFLQRKLKISLEKATELITKLKINGIATR